MRGKNNVFSPVFLCGHPRSGTTFLARLLDGHENLSVFPEETLFRKWSKMSARPPADWIKFLLENTLVRNLGKKQIGDTIKARGRISNVSFSLDSLFEKIKVNLGPNSSAPVFFEELNKVFMEMCYENMTSNMTYVEKTPSNEYRLHEFFKIWPNSRAIYIYRHPLDSIYSHALKNGKWTGISDRDYNRRLVDWKNSIYAIRKIAIKYPEKVLFVKYEELLSAREEVIKSVSEFLNISFNDSLLIPTYMKKPWVGVSSNNTEMKANKTTNSNWERELSERQIISAHRYLFKELFYLGYPPLQTYYPSKKELFGTFFTIPFYSIKGYIKSSL